MTLLSQVFDEKKKAEKESAKAKLKALIVKRADLKETVVGVENEIVEILSNIGETEDEIREFLSEN